jgi:hypothetical protein
MDVWLPLTKKENQTGEVRVLVSYAPNGISPQPNDLVALEAFARRSLEYSLMFTSNAAPAATKGAARTRRLLRWWSTECEMANVLL